VTAQPKSLLWPEPPVSCWPTGRPSTSPHTAQPVGTALGAPPKPVTALLPPAVKWEAFFRRQAKNPKYLRHGDIVELSVATDDGAIDLGTQRTAVRYA